MPNRTRAKLMLVAAWFCTAIGALAGISGLSAIFSSAYAHSHWPVVKGDILSYEQKSAEETSANSRRNVYWIEFQVEFDPGRFGCTTGSTWGVPSKFPCIGSLRTQSTSSWADAMQRVRRHPPRSGATFLYDPASSRLRFADETAADVFPPEDILVLVVAGGCGLLLIWVVRRRLRFLRTLPEDYDATPPASGSKSEPDELTDLKLS